MKSLQKLLICVVLILFIFGCGSTIKTVITSHPLGALIYGGETANDMSYVGTTPMTLKFNDNDPYWQEYYYQIRKPGYKDSELIFKPQEAIGADRYVHATLEPLGEKDTYAEREILIANKEEIKPAKSETELDDGRLKSVVYIRIPSYIYTKPNFEGEMLIFLDEGTELTIIGKKENWTNVKSPYFGMGWIQTDRVVADATEVERTEQETSIANKEEIKQPKSETKLEGENSKCAEIQRLSDELMSLMKKLNFDKHNEISLKILRLMEELHTAGSDKQIPDCDQVVHIAFCRKATVSFSGKGLIDRDDARITYNMSAKTPAILQIDFTVFPKPLEVMGYGFMILSELSCPSTHVEFKGRLKDFEKWVQATQFELIMCPIVQIGGSKMVIEPYFSVPFTAGVKSPQVSFYSSKRPLPSYPSASTLDWLHWSPIYPTEQDLQKAFEKGQLILKRKTEKKSVTGTVIIDFEPPDPKLQASGQSNSGGIGLWGDRTTHGGFLLATEQEVFGDDHPVAKEGDPVLCPIHGLTKVSRDESSGVYIGDKTVALAGGKAECGAEILSKSTLVEVQPVKQHMKKPTKPKHKPLDDYNKTEARERPLDKPPVPREEPDEAKEKPLYDDDKLPVPWDEPDEAKERPLYDDDILPVPWDEPDGAKERTLEEPPQAKERTLEEPGQAKKIRLYDDDILPVPWDEPDEAKEKPLDKPKGYDIAD
jgi:uncharacterized Zn-binding protein involved in type VI secretion